MTVTLVWCVRCYFDNVARLDAVKCRWIKLPHSLPIHEYKLKMKYWKEELKIKVPEYISLPLKPQYTLLSFKNLTTLRINPQHTNTLPTKLSWTIRDISVYESKKGQWRKQKVKLCTRTRTHAGGCKSQEGPLPYCKTYSFVSTGVPY